MKPCRGSSIGFLLPCSFLLLLSAAFSPLSAQTEQTVFADDFEDGAIDEAKWRVNREPFESGGNPDAINASESGGVIEFSGTASERWWSGISVATVPTFTASRETNLVITVDRVSVSGEGSAYRSNVWLTEEGRARYVFFGEDVGETGWQYNRKINLPGDNPTGSGTGPAVWDAFEDGGSHQMKLIANGETVRLFVDEIQGAEVDFPLRGGIVFELGGYARNTNDSVTAVYDNVTIAQDECAAFLEQNLVANVGETVTATVRIPAILNADTAVSVTVTSSDPSVARPVGGSNGSLVLTFPPGASNVQAFELETLQQGAVTFSLQTAAEVCLAGALFVTSPFDVGVHIDDDFRARDLNTGLWEITNQGLENGTGAFNVTQPAGTLSISGEVTASSWGGTTVKTQQGFTATPDLNLVFEVDRVSRDTQGVGRTDVIIANADRSQFVAFGERFAAPGLEDVPESGWVVSSSFTDPTGSGGTLLTAFNDKLDGGNYQIKFVANGESVEFFLDGESAGRFVFPVQAGIHVELGVFGELQTDTVTGVFDNARLATELACISISPDTVLLELAETGGEATVRVPEPLLRSGDVNVTITSADPTVAVPAGGDSDSLTLNFAAGGANTQSFEIATRGIGTTTFELSSDAPACNGPGLPITVNPVPLTFISDDFSNGIDNAVWQIDETSLEDGIAAPGTEVIVNDQDQVRFTVIAADGGFWPGRALTTVDTFSASATEPLTFTIERVKHEGRLVTGTTAEQRTGVWIMDANRDSFIFFFDSNTSLNVQGGWKYFQNDLTGNGTPIDAFGEAQYNDRGYHEVRVVADGANALLFLDGIFGTRLPFAVTEGIRVGFGAYVRAPTDEVYGTFDNALLTGGMDPDQPVPGETERPVLAISRVGLNLQIEWDNGKLQSAPSVTGPWSDVMDGGNPAVNPQTVAIDQEGEFFRAVVE